MMLLHPAFTQPASRHLCAHTTLDPLPADLLHLRDMVACFELASQATGAATPSTSAPFSVSKMSGACSEAPSARCSSSLAALLLVYPCLDPTRSGPSHTAHAASPTLAAAELMWFWKHYVPGFNIDASGSAGALYCLLNAEDDAFRRMPPCFVATAGQDPLCDDGMSLVARLKVRSCHTSRCLSHVAVFVTRRAGSRRSSPSTP